MRDEGLAFLAERPLGVLATSGADGTPHAVPVELVVENGKVYCWCESDSVKVRNVARTGRAALVAYKGNDFVLVRGNARLIGSDDPAYAALTQRFLEKYKRDEEYGNDVLVELSAERVSARVE